MVSLVIEHLPLEVLEVLVTFLSAKDLTNCIGVSVTWYRLFSDDLFWKRHCISSNHYFSKTKCLVEPVFQLTDNAVLPIEENRLRFLQEQHVFNNWRCGRFRKEIIEYELDGSNSMYPNDLEFLDNDHIYEDMHTLHKNRTYEARVWNVAETPVLVLTIPYCLCESWPAKVYKIVNSNVIVVIQCNVVQVYKICLDSKNWVLNHVFFFDKPEEFSRSLTADSNVKSIFDSTRDRSNRYECVVCGHYFIGACINSESPLLHIWDIKTGEKVKEDRYEIGHIESITFICNERVSTDKVLVNYKLKHEEWTSIIYDTSLLQFILPSRFVRNGHVLYFGGHLSVIGGKPIKIVHHSDATNQKKNMTELSKSLDFDYVDSSTVLPLGSNLLISTEKEIYLVNPVNLETRTLIRTHLCWVDVLANRFILLHDIHDISLKEVWEIGKTECKKVLEFSWNCETVYSASNSVCSKVVLENFNRIIVLHFW
ncbi:uncharacterized protein LOC128995208 [Macrosteles quadrilineatus]|uniref:uncharacterized protein LOC128995208 n=1 Tax=Macrosteles quadrilineatus TaxID=74068 RepID=UPI0023E0C9F8|nr:uncharacterized protein LOC128995208 [Macrosteles quadrilineatus]